LGGFNDILSIMRKTFTGGRHENIDTGYLSDITRRRKGHICPVEDGTIASVGDLPPGFKADKTIPGSGKLSSRDS
jgi:hypothetical protein